ncbi:MAG TPA: DNA mismatch repair protein MutL, partial [Mariprofundaceae bacterium]|nr:DNA mismatch repair protein MutL [Mariprofundaceae bacterium]
IEVLDLFLNTPARLNFMRSDKTEEAAIIEAFRSLALANPATAMSLDLDGRNRFDFRAGAEAERVLAVMGEEFAANSIEQVIEHEGIRVAGHLGLATYHHRDSTRMLFLVNGRVIRDKQLLGALRAGYRDVMFHDRYPVAVLRIDIDPADVDVNVHPAKREVRFRSPQTVNSAVIACARAAIERMGQSVSALPAQAALDAMRRTHAASRPYSGGGGFSLPKSFPSHRQPVPADIQRRLFAAPEAREPAGEYATSGLDLGRPLAQIHRCYILAETDDGVILVDQHAAHERINFEAMKEQLEKGALRTQLLLHPADWQVSAHEAAWLHDHADELSAFGVELDAAGDELFRIRSLPAQLAGEPPVAVVAELVDACMQHGAATEGRGRVLERWLGNRACKGSIKSGHTLSHDAQVALLRTMETTPNIAQCNHGRPTYVRLSLNDLDRLFGRKE